jgi:hypothetical protein
LCRMRRQLESFDESYMTILPGGAKRSLLGSRLCASYSRSTYNGGNMMDSATRHLLTDVMAVNPGPFTIIRALMALPTWYQLLHHCKDQGLVGSVRN